MSKTVSKPEGKQEGKENPKNAKLLEKLHSIKASVPQVVLGDVVVPTADIVDIAPMTSSTQKPKLMITFKQNGALKYTLIGLAFVDAVEECIKTGGTLSIRRESMNKTDVMCE